MDARQERGLALSQNKGIKQVRDGLWTVPSATGHGSYAVDAKAGVCTCPDHETRGVRCKHLFAVEFVMKATVIETVTKADGSEAVRETTTEVRVRYTQNWPAYNAAQTGEKEHVTAFLRALCDGIVQPAQGRGRPRLPLSDLTFAAAMKVYSGMSGATRYDGHPRVRCEGAARRCAALQLGPRLHRTRRRDAAAQGARRRVCRGPSRRSRRRSPSTLRASRRARTRVGSTTSTGAS